LSIESNSRVPLTWEDFLRQYRCDRTREPERSSDGQYRKRWMNSTMTRGTSVPRVCTDYAAQKSGDFHGPDAVNTSIGNQPTAEVPTCDDRGRTAGTNTVPSVLVHTKRCIEGLEQSRVAERLEQAFRRAPFDQPLANLRISISGDEDNRNRLSPPHQFLLKIRPGHSRHSDIEEQTSGLVDAIRREEIFRRRERAGCETELLQQVRQRLADGAVVVDYGDK